MQFPAQRHFSARAANCQESTLVYYRTPNHLDQKAKKSGERILPLYVYEIILFCRMVKFHFPMVKIPFPYISCPKTQSQFILFQYTNVHLSAKFGDLKPTIDEKLCPLVIVARFCTLCKSKNLLPCENNVQKSVTQQQQFIHPGPARRPSRFCPHRKRRLPSPPI